MGRRRRRPIPDRPAADTRGPPTGPVLTLDRITTAAPPELAAWLRDRKNRRAIPHRLEEVGYIAVRNPGDKSDGRWKIDGKGQVLYVDKKLSVRDRTAVAMKFAGAR